MEGMVFPVSRLDRVGDVVRSSCGCLLYDTIELSTSLLPMPWFELLLGLGDVAVLGCIMYVDMEGCSLHFS